MAKITHEGFLEAMTVLDEYSEEKVGDVIAKENIVDTYDDKLSAYLTRLSSQNLSYKDSLKVTSLLHCLTDFERISDHSINVVENAQQMVKEGAVFSKKAKEEMLVYSAALRDILERTTNAFVEGDEALARTVEPLEEVIDELNKKVKKNHMKRLRKGKCTIELGLVLSDLAMNYERVADHCSNIAVYMMQLEDTQLEEHSFTEQMDAEESAEFTKQLNEFEKMYQI
jgi:phosphate:Na+ symporter